MKFEPGKPNPYYDDYNYLNRLESENNKWGIAFYPVIPGIRVVIFLIDSPSITLNICAGNQEVYQILIYQLILSWLMTFDESVTEWELQKEFPQFDIKPIYNDPNWQKNLDIIKNRILNNKKNTEELTPEL